MKLYELKKIDTDFKKVKISSAKESYEYIKQFYSDDLEIYESCFILLLNRRNETIGYAKISQGGIAGAVVDLKIIAKYCIDSLACSFILAHNHPSGDNTPSNADISITNKCKEMSKYIEVVMLDHLIICVENYYSFAENSKI